MLFGVGRCVFLNSRLINHTLFRVRPLSSNSWNSHSRNFDYFRKLAIVGGASIAALYFGFSQLKTTPFRRCYLESCKLSRKSMGEMCVPPDRPDLPTFSLDDIKNHGKNSERIWGVYDVTEFVSNHPGGDKILLAAGSSVEPYWAIYAQHKTPEVMEILEDLRIGNLNKKDLQQLSEKKKDANDPFGTDPQRHPALLVNSEKPFNAETPSSLLLDNFLTPNDLFFVRNHMPVPGTDERTHKLDVNGLGISKPINLSMWELKTKYAPISVTSVVQCAGNRRNDMNNYKKVQGLMWTGTAISNAKWTGVRLRDLLIEAGVDPNDKRIKHVHLEGADKDMSGTHYGASITFEKAMGDEVIVAYAMNDEDIPRDHGYPLRLVAPGIVGARQVKWLTKILLSDVESPSHWQRKDYRAFSPSVNIGDPIHFDSVPSIQEYPVQSAICNPTPNSRVYKGNTFEVSGYAWSGGGRGIIRVEVSADDGKTWQCAKLEQDPSQDLEHMWAWTLWKADVKVPENTEKMVILCKATDRAYNTQPETAAGLWNVRGLLHNAWHRVLVEVV